MVKGLADDAIGDLKTFNLKQLGQQRQKKDNEKTLDVRIHPKTRPKVAANYKICNIPVLIS